MCFTHSCQLERNIILFWCIHSVMFRLILLHVCRLSVSIWGSQWTCWRLGNHTKLQRLLSITPWTLLTSKSRYLSDYSCCGLVFYAGSSNYLEFHLKHMNINVICYFEGYFLCSLEKFNGVFVAMICVWSANSIMLPNDHRWSSGSEWMNNALSEMTDTFNYSSPQLM